VYNPKGDTFTKKEVRYKGAGGGCARLSTERRRLTTTLAPSHSLAHSLNPIQSEQPISLPLLHSLTHSLTHSLSPPSGVLTAHVDDLRVIHKDKHLTSHHISHSHTHSRVSSDPSEYYTIQCSAVQCSAVTPQ
jgi:hypothetical protein